MAFYVNFYELMISIGASKIKKNAFIDSAGTASYHIRRSPDPKSILVAKEKGIDISNYKARKFIE